MDAVAGLLDGPRTRGAFLLRSSMDPPWSLRIQDEAPLTLVAVVRGQAWIVPDGGRAVRLGHGDVAVIRAPDPLRIAVRRAWFARPGADAPRWYRAYGDPVVGRALRLLHRNPAHPWTVAELAAAANVSRASLARRFTELVGEPPMAFLTSWRLALAADLLREPGATI